jgi:hypothetical protein
MFSFLPLSFFTSLFGINAREWSGEQTNPSLAEMFQIAGTSFPTRHINNKTNDLQLPLPSG